MYKHQLVFKGKFKGKCKQKAPKARFTFPFLQPAIHGTDFKQ